MQYLTRYQDVLDEICYKHYGASADYTEQVLANNPGLANYGPILPANIVIELLDLPDVEVSKNIERLWD